MRDLKPTSNRPRLLIVPLSGPNIYKLPNQQVAIVMAAVVCTSLDRGENLLVWWANVCSPDLSCPLLSSPVLFCPPFLFILLLLLPTLFSLKQDLMCPMLALNSLRSQEWLFDVLASFSPVLGLQVWAMTPLLSTLSYLFFWGKKKDLHRLVMSLNLMLLNTWLNIA